MLSLHLLILLHKPLLLGQLLHLLLLPQLLQRQWDLGVCILCLERSLWSVGFHRCKFSLRLLELLFNGEDTASGLRWLTAQGSFEGSIAEIDVFESTGGSFDDPQVPSTTNVGTMSLDFTDCSNALLTYSLTDNGAEGDIDITRVIPGGKALCEELGRRSPYHCFGSEAAIGNCKR